MFAPGETFSASYPAVPESVPRARTELTAFASEAGAGGDRLDAIRLAASEAVTNAVMHAYRSGQKASGKDSAAIHVTASYVAGEVWVLIADAGTGLRARSSSSSGLGLGLALIAQLADDLQILSRSTGGTELRMCFKLRFPQSRPSAQPRGSASSAFSPACSSFSTTR
jgi:anti-sigma regulatory factor (Ser/Thr protein kinase)